jgi:hypothetical protein
MQYEELLVHANDAQPMKDLLEAKHVFELRANMHQVTPKNECQDEKEDQK